MLKFNLDFLFKIQKLKHIKRQNIVENRPESVAEHTWGLAMLAILLYEENLPINLNHALKMALIHDLGELELGDVSVYDIEDEKERQNAERTAVNQILKDYPELYNIWEEFEENKTLEAQYIQSLDQLESVIHNITEQGKSWKKFNRDKDTVYNYKITHINSGFYPLLKTLIEEADRNNCFALEKNDFWDKKKPICVVGIHSSGKTTLVKRLVEENSWQLLNRVEFQIKTDDPFRRAMARLLKYYFESLDQVQVQQNHPESIFISDRCVYDTLAYVDGYYELEWITKSQKETVFNMYHDLFKPEILPQKIIFLDPPIGWVKRRLEKRLKTNEKWRESNFDYLEVVAKKYRKIFYDNCYNFPIDVIIVTETNLEKRLEKIREYIMAKTT